MMHVKISTIAKRHTIYDNEIININEVNDDGDELFYEFPKY